MAISPKLQHLIILLTLLQFALGCKPQASPSISPGSREMMKGTPLRTLLDSASGPLPRFLSLGFEDLLAFEDDGEEYIVSAKTIGKIKLASGRVIACDPIVMQDGIPFQTQFPVGEFPVQLSIADTKLGSKVAMSRIQFSSNPVTRWEFALLAGQKSIPIWDSLTYCFGVDAGVAMFIDSVANRAIEAADPMYMSNVFFTMDADFVAEIKSFAGYNYALFTSGWGDGCYNTYVGFDADSLPCILLADFQVVDWWSIENPRLE